MDGFLSALRSENYISLRSRTARFLLLLPALVVALRLLIAKLAESGLAARDALLSSSAGADAPVTGGYAHFADAAHTSVTLLGLLLVGQAASSFAYDRDTGLLRHLLIRRCSRTAVTLAKLTHLHLHAALSLLLLIITAWVLAGQLWGFGPVMEDGYELIGSTEIRRELILGLQLAIIPLPAAIAFGLLISVLSQTATQSLAVALGATLAMDVFKSLLGDKAYYLYASFQASLLDQSYLGDVTRLVRGYSDVLLDPQVLQLNYWVPVPQMLLLAAIAVFFANRKKL